MVLKTNVFPPPLGRAVAVAVSAAPLRGAPLSSAWGPAAPTRANLRCHCVQTRTLSITSRKGLSYWGHSQQRPFVAGPSSAAAVAHRCAFHRTTPAGMPRRRSFFTSNVLLNADGSESGGRPGASEANSKPSSSETASLSPSAAATAAAKRKPRSAGAKHSLRRVAAIAQDQTGDAGVGKKVPSTRLQKLRREAQELGEAEEEADDGSNVISAVCLAESFDMERVMAILRRQGFHLDPDGSGFESHEVVHARKWWQPEPLPDDEGGPTASEGRDVDLFVFESGTLVGWGLPAAAVDALATAHLVAAAADPFVAERETETLEFRRDASRETSAMRGDVVVLGTRHEVADADRLATTRAQIAFSSGLARSTKLAALERSFTDYFESTRRIPEMLARPKGGRRGGGGGGVDGGTGLGGGLPHLSQKFILQKTGELLSLRAQLNHYRELTDALPDIFWDARAELGLEGYYEQVGRALDVGVRIKTLNQKMDYAQEIATVLREISSERHGTRLEWIIIVLIAVEVVFELRRVYLERLEKRRGEESHKHEEYRE